MAYRRWYANLSPQEQAIERQREHERDLARMNAAAMMAPMMLYNTQQSFNNMRMTPPAPVTMPTTRQPLNCTSTPFGIQVNTTCY
jgi:hypothetical protein